MGISPNMVKAITDITGEPRLELAIHDILRDALEHRVEKIKKSIEEFEEKYRMSFKEFDNKFQKNEIPDQFSYRIEKDYLEWEGLTSRHKKHEKILGNIL